MVLRRELAWVRLPALLELKTLFALERGRRTRYDGNEIEQERCISARGTLFGVGT